MVDTTFFENKGPFTLQHIAEICDAKLADCTKAQVTINDIATMDKAGDHELCFFYDRKIKEKGAAIKATACVTTEELAPFVAEGVIILTTKNPKLALLSFTANICRKRILLQPPRFIRARLSGRTALLVNMPLSAKMSKSAKTVLLKPAW